MNRYSNFPTREISYIAERESWRKEVNRPIYHIHKYWAQRLGSVFRAIQLYLMNERSASTWDDFYNKHSYSEKIVLDPFMGSGTTIGEALKLGAKVVGCDINPLSTFLVKQALTDVPIEKLDNAFHVIERNVAQKIRLYYKTLDVDNRTELNALYYFWVKIVEIPTGEEIPLFSKFIFAQNAYTSKKPTVHIVCPNCYSIFKGKYNDVTSTCPHCGHIFNPQNGPVNNTIVTDSKGNTFKIKDLVPSGHLLKEKMYAVLAIDENGNKKYLPIRDYDIKLYEKAKNELSSFSGFLPYYKVYSGFNTDQARGYNYNNWKDFFNARQLLCLGLLLEEILSIKDKAVREQFLCLFSSTLEYNNMFCSYKGEGTGAVRPIFSNHIIKPERTPLENSVWGYPESSGCFSTLYKTRLLKAKEYLRFPFEIKIDPENGKSSKVPSSNSISTTVCDSWAKFLEIENSAALILNGDSSSLPIPSEVIDLIVTDPPYFNFVHYSELSDFFYAWLSPILKDEDSSFTKESARRDNEVQQTDAQLFSKLLSSVFVECHRVLKADGKLAFTFHHSKIEGWYAIAKAIYVSGFYVEECVPVHAELMASTPKANTKEPISIDAVIVCGKKTLYDSIDILKEKALYYTNEFKNNRQTISKADIFVICASQCLNIIITEKQSLELASLTVNSIYKYVTENML